MSHLDYEVSKRIAARDYPFFALIMAAMRGADGINLILLQQAFPKTFEGLRAEHHAADELSGVERDTAFHDRAVSKQIAAENHPFYALIMAAMRRAESKNLELLKQSFPKTFEELRDRYNAPKGLLGDERNPDSSERIVERSRITNPEFDALMRRIEAIPVASPSEQQGIPSYDEVRQLAMLSMTQANALGTNSAPNPPSVRAPDSPAAPQTTRAGTLSASHLGDIAEQVGSLMVLMQFVNNDCQPIYQYYHGRNSFHALALLLRLAPKRDFKRHVAELERLRNATQGIIAQVASHLSLLKASASATPEVQALTAECLQVHYDGTMVIAFIDWVDAKRRGDRQGAASYARLWWKLASEARANAKRVDAFRHEARQMGWR